jgi:hypothetical protein
MRTSINPASYGMFLSCPSTRRPSEFCRAELDISSLLARIIHDGSSRNRLKTYRS